MLLRQHLDNFLWMVEGTVYPKEYAHGFVVLCFVVVMQSFIMNSHEVFIHIHQGCFAGTGAIVRLPQCQWSKPDGYGKLSQCITTAKHSKAKTVCIFLGIYCSLSACIYIIAYLFDQQTISLSALCSRLWEMSRYIFSEPSKGIYICILILTTIHFYLWCKKALYMEQFIIRIKKFIPESNPFVPKSSCCFVGSTFL